MEKIENYQLLQVIEKLWKQKKLVVVRIVIGWALSCTDMFEIYSSDLNDLSQYFPAFQNSLKELSTIV